MLQIASTQIPELLKIEISPRCFVNLFSAPHRSSISFRRKLERVLPLNQWSSSFFRLCQPSGVLDRRVLDVCEMIEQLSATSSSHALSSMIRTLQVEILPRIKSEGLVSSLLRTAPMKKVQKIPNQEIEEMLGRPKDDKNEVENAQTQNDIWWEHIGNLGHTEDRKCHSNSRPTDQNFEKISRMGLGMMLILHELIQYERLMHLNVEDVVTLTQWCSNVLTQMPPIQLSSTDMFLPRPSSCRTSPNEVERPVACDRILGPQMISLGSFEELVVKLWTGVAKIIEIGEFQQMMTPGSLTALLDSFKRIKNAKMINLSEQNTPDLSQFVRTKESLGRSAVRLSTSFQISELFNVLCLCVEVGCNDQILDSLSFRLCAFLGMTQRKGTIQRAIDVLPINQMNQNLHNFKSTGDLVSIY